MGLVHTERQCVRLWKAIYGLVQVSRQYFKMFTKILKGLGFMGGDVDPCLMVKQSDVGIVYIGIYVDDCLLVGDIVVIEWTVDALNKEFTTKQNEGLDDYLSCEV